MKTTTISLFSSLLLISFSGSSAFAGPVKVTSGADSGAGSLREAITEANADPSVTSVVISKKVGLIEVETPVEYTGSQALSIDGNGVTVVASDAFAGLGLLISSGGADLAISRLIVDGDFEEGEALANGIYVPVAAGETGEIAVSIKDVTLVNCGLFGLHVADQLNDSDASISLDVLNCLVENNGIGALDYDGIRVDEGGNGDLFARIVNSDVNANGGDGLELDERGDGSVEMEVVSSNFNFNGPFNEEDLDDGLDIDEAGDGGIFASVVGSSFSNNFDEGLDLDEEGPGDVQLEVTNSEANANNDEGIKADEEQEGSIVLILHNVETSGSANQDGVQLEEADEGDFTAEISNFTSIGNNGDGLKLEEGDEGDFAAVINNFTSIANDGDCLDLDQDTVDADSGSLKLRRAVIEFNGDNTIDVDGIDEN